MQSFAYDPNSDSGSERGSPEVDNVPQAESPFVEVEETVISVDGPAPPTPVPEAKLPPTEVSDGSDEGASTVSSRAYQLEVFEQSLQRNVILSVSEQPRTAKPHHQPLLRLFAC
jgi:hypothetical protein